MDGGLILVGVDEGPPAAINPVPLSGLAERIEQIGLMAVAEPVVVSARLLRSSDDPNLGVLAVEIPSSPRAPHMADGRYYARGDKTTTTLSDQQIIRYHELRFAARADLTSEALAIVEAAAPAPLSLLGIVAEPLASVRDFLEDLTGHPTWHDEIRELVRGAVTNLQHQYSPTLAAPLRGVRRANGVALTTSAEPIGSYRFGTAEVTLKESGRIVLISERSTELRSFTSVSPQPPDLKLVRDDLIVGNAELVARLAAQVGKKYDYYGAWRIAIVATGLDAASSPKTLDPFGEPGPEYTEDIYSRAVESTFAELDGSPQQVTARLVLPLLRSLDVHEHPNWKYLSPT